MTLNNILIIQAYSMIVGTIFADVSILPRFSQRFSETSVLSMCKRRDAFLTEMISRHSGNSAVGFDLGASASAKAGPISLAI